MGQKKIFIFKKKLFLKQLIFEHIYIIYNVDIAQWDAEKKVCSHSRSQNYSFKTAFLNHIVLLPIFMSLATKCGLVTNSIYSALLMGK